MQCICMVSRAAQISLEEKIIKRAKVASWWFTNLVRDMIGRKLTGFMVR